MRKYFRKNESGAALLFSIILISIMLGVGLTLSTIFVGKLRASIDAKSSIGAYYAADSGIEWKLYEKRVGPEAFGNQLGIGSEFEIDETEEYMRSLGTYRGVSRAIEVFDLEISPTPTPPPACPDFTLGAVQDSITDDQIVYLISASIPGVSDTGRSFLLTAGGDYQLLQIYARRDVDRMESITFIPDDGGAECARTLSNLAVPKAVIPVYECSDIEPIVLSETHTETDEDITFTLTSNRSGVFIGGNIRLYGKGAVARIETVTFVADYQSLGCTQNITLSIPAASLPAPKYEWTEINTPVLYPAPVGKLVWCGDRGTTRQSWTCNKDSQGQVYRIYQQYAGISQVGDRIGNGWLEAFSADRSIGTYTRWTDCIRAGATVINPLRWYQCQNVGGPEPLPTTGPAYQWIKVAQGPRGSLDVASAPTQLTRGFCSGTTSIVATCNSSNEGKKAITESLATSYAIVADRGSYWQGTGATLQANQYELVVRGYNPATCSGGTSTSSLGAGYGAYVIWQCVETAPIAMDDQNDSILARLWGAIINLFR